jgi:hypothetical protein
LAELWVSFLADSNDTQDTASASENSEQKVVAHQRPKQAMQSSIHMGVSPVVPTSINKPKNIDIDVIPPPSGSDNSGHLTLVPPSPTYHSPPKRV